MTGRDDRAAERDKAAAERDLQASVKEALTDENTMSEQALDARADARSAWWHAGEDRRASAQDRAAAAEARRAAERTGR